MNIPPPFASHGSLESAGMSTIVAVLIAVGAMLTFVYVGLLRPESKRMQRKREALVTIYGMDQVRGMTLEQARFAAMTGLIQPVIPTDEARKILDGLE